MNQLDHPAAWVESIVQDFVNSSPENTLQNQANEKAFENPLVGFSRGDDPLYETYKEYVGPSHSTPWEIFNQTFPETRVEPKELTVICWILSQTKATKADNRKQTVYPAERWARARMFGEEVNDKLRRHVVDALKENGYEAVAPVLSPQFTRKTTERYGLYSTWSERHVAYASGLGTFGLCGSLITPRGKAVRVGSVVARIQIPPTPRPYEDHRAYCLFSTQGICGKCISRCPVGAITETAHDKTKCQNHIKLTTTDFVQSHYGFYGHACGLCQTGVPCESMIPMKRT